MTCVGYGEIHISNNIFLSNVLPFLLYPSYSVPIRNPARALLIVGINFNSSFMPWKKCLESEVTGKGE